MASNSEVRLERVKLQHATADKVLDRSADVLLAALRNPAITMIGGVALTEYLEKKKLITGIEAGAINSVLISANLVTSLAPAAPIIAGLVK